MLTKNLFNSSFYSLYVSLTEDVNRCVDRKYIEKLEDTPKIHLIVDLSERKDTTKSNSRPQ